MHTPYAKERPKIRLHDGEFMSWDDIGTSIASSSRYFYQRKRAAFIIQYLIYSLRRGRPRGKDGVRENIFKEESVMKEW